MIAAQRDSQRRFRIALSRVQDALAIVRLARRRCLEAIESEARISPRPLIRAVCLSEDAESHLASVQHLETIQISKIRFLIEVAVECLVYAQESIRYEEFHSAIVDLDRTDHTLERLSRFLEDHIEPSPIETVNSWLKPKIHRVLWFRHLPEPEDASARPEREAAATLNGAYPL